MLILETVYQFYLIHFLVLSTVESGSKKIQSTNTPRHNKHMLCEPGLQHF